MHYLERRCCLFYNYSVGTCEMEAPMTRLSLTELLGLHLPTYRDLGKVGDSAGHILMDADDLSDVDKVKLHLISGYVAAKNGQHTMAQHHFMFAFDLAHAM